jgi:hypothetical protein
VPLSRSLLRLVVATGTGALLAIGMAATAFADDGPPNYIENVAVTLRIDVHSHVAVATVSVDCVADAGFVRIRLNLSEKDGASQAFSQETTATSCVAGTSISTDIAFGQQQGTFKPGKASIQGFAAATNGLTGDDLEEIPATKVILKPH